MSYENQLEQMGTAVNEYVEKQIQRIYCNIVNEETTDWNVGVVMWSMDRGNTDTYIRALIDDPRTYDSMQRQNKAMNLNWNAALLSLLFFNRDEIEEVIEDKLPRLINTFRKDVDQFMKAVNKYYIISPEKPSMKSMESKVYAYSAPFNKVYFLTKIQKSSTEAMRDMNRIARALAKRTFAGEKPHTLLLEGQSEFIDWLAELK